MPVLFLCVFFVPFHFVPKVFRYDLKHQLAQTEVLLEQTRISISVWLAEMSCEWQKCHSQLGQDF